jgi:hypothetical protein
VLGCSGVDLWLLFRSFVCHTTGSRHGLLPAESACWPQLQPTTLHVVNVQGYDAVDLEDLQEAVAGGRSTLRFAAAKGPGG